MSVMDVINFIAPLLLTFLVQGLKKLISINGYVALVVVFVIGGLGALAGVGPSVGSGWVDTTINTGWIVGVATFIYSLIKKRSS
jgi:hypothetical protein